MVATQLVFLEELEPRIAPATFLMGADSQITGAGADANLTAHATDAAWANYADPHTDGYAFLFKKGDKLVFDANGNGFADKTEALLLNVAAGSALVFFGEHDGFYNTPFAITGISVSDKFAGGVYSTVNGSVVTALGVNGHLTLKANALDVQFASISSLVVTGYVDGTILAGGAISNVSIAGASQAVGKLGLSTEGIFTGDAVIGADGYTLGLHSATDQSFDKKGVIGGSITNVILAGAAKKISAGNGNLADADLSNPKAKPLAGGSISKVTLNNNAVAGGFESVEIRAGNGSNGALKIDIHSNPIAGSAGGAGGLISGVTVKYGSLGLLLIHAGNGGNGEFRSAGGVGGSVSAVTGILGPVGALNGNVEILAGEGGVGGVSSVDFTLQDSTILTVHPIGVGGAGGNISNIDLTAVGAAAGIWDIQAGSGSGTSGLVSTGGNGGSVSIVKFSGTNLGSATILGGDAGSVESNSARAGSIGGSVSNISIAMASLEADILIAAGNGSAGADKWVLKPVKNTTHYTATAVGMAGGAGGSVTGVSALITTSLSGQFTTEAGTGGNGSEVGAGNGGAGGKVADVIFNAVYDKKNKTWNPLPSATPANVEVSISGAKGGNGKIAGAGGLVTDVRAFTQDALIEIQSGNGGDSTGTGAKDGAGGNINDIIAISMATKAPATDPAIRTSGITFQAGSAGVHTDIGHASSNVGLGAVGGSISTVISAGYKSQIVAGHGSAGTIGGAGGSVTSSILTNNLTAVGDLTVHAGDGGQGLNGVGGAGGLVKGVIADSAGYAQNLIPKNISLINHYQGHAGNFALTGNLGDLDLNGGVTSDAAPTVWSTPFAGNVTLEANIYGDVHVSGRIDGNLIFKNAIYGRVILNGVSDGSLPTTSIGGDLSLLAGNIGVYVEYLDTVTHSTVVVTLAEYLAGTDGHVIIEGAHSISANPLSIEGWQVAGFNLDLKAGNGGQGSTNGGAGGSILSNAFSSYPVLTSLASQDLDWSMKAGDGGEGGINGGAGGAIAGSTGAYSTKSFGQFIVESGAGGQGGVTGGNGGKLSGTIFVTQTSGTSTFQVFAGSGGLGTKTGGTGGSLADLGVYGSTLTEVGGLTGSVTAGNGGGANSQGTAGAGGGVSNLQVGGFVHSSIAIAGGDAGAGGAKAVAGSSISGVTITPADSADFTITAGDGALGGAGGSIQNVTALPSAYSKAGIYYLPPAFFNLTLKAGDGSVGSISGAGGSINTVNLIAPMAGKAFSLVAGLGADGTKPGAGGILDGINLIDAATVTVAGNKRIVASFDYSASDFPGLGSATLESGKGGNDSASPLTAGAKGGDIRNVKWNLDELARTIAFGEGGTGNPAGAKGVPINVNWLPPIPA